MGGRESRDIVETSKAIFHNTKWEKFQVNANKYVCLCFHKISEAVRAIVSQNFPEYSVKRLKSLQDSPYISIIK